MKVYSAIEKKKKKMKHWYRLQPGSMLNERSQAQMTTYYMIPFVWNLQKRQTQRVKKYINGCQGIDERKTESDFFFW